MGNIVHSEKMLGRLNSHLPRGSIVIKEEKVLGHCAESDSESYRIEQVCLDHIQWLMQFFVSVGCIFI